MRAFRLLVSVAACATALSATAWATDYYARGEFNGWSTDNLLTFQGGDEWGGTVTGLTPGQAYEYKVATDDWSTNAPNSNGKIVADASGAATFHFHETASWNDGWYPADERRVGYDNPGQFNWEVIGSFDNWTNGLLTLADQGGGLLSGDIALNAGDYNFKFRKENDWGISIGSDFGNSAGDNALHVANDGDIIRFSLDLVGGAWQTSTVPEPTALALFAAALLLGIRRR